MQLTRLASFLLALVVSLTPLHSFAAEAPAKSNTTTVQKKSSKTTTATKKKSEPAKAVNSKKTTATKTANNKKSTGSQAVKNNSAKTATTQKKTATKTPASKTVKSSTKKTTTAKTAVTPSKKSQGAHGVKGAALTYVPVQDSTSSYRVKGETHTVIGQKASLNYSRTGVASFYAGKFHGRKTANGEIYNQNAYTAAHKTLAIGSYALVTNLENGRKVIVRINDRGPFSQGRIIDLSRAAAQEIGMIQKGTVRVKVEAMQVDSQGYISGKGAEALQALAKREGFDLKVKETEAATAENNEAEALVKPVEKSTENAQKTAQTAFLKVMVNTEQEAEKLKNALSEKANVAQSGERYEVIIPLNDPATAHKVKQQIQRLGYYQIFTYTEN